MFKSIFIFRILTPNVHNAFIHILLSVMLSEVGPIILDFRSEKSFTLTDIIRSSRCCIMYKFLYTHLQYYYFGYVICVPSMYDVIQIFTYGLYLLIVNNHKKIGKIKE